MIGGRSRCSWEKLKSFKAVLMTWLSRALSYQRVELLNKEFKNQ